ncbi:MAG: PhnD/SsuA/transferrin family substrate-binding protein, partial [Chloroflexi bacterium]|nr:PhnD/SsuA/transferrin family substrate-binding protein [Chloroflexota bacterium]
NLRGAFSPNPRLQPFLNGTVAARDVNIAWELGDPGSMFARHLRDSAFDIFEFSISDYLIARERPRPAWDWTAIPVFLSRAFLGLNTWVNARSGIETAEDLKGKRFGLADYTMTAGLWFRAMLAELHGIQPQDMAWFVGRLREHSHGALLGLHEDPPRGISITWLDREGALNEMLQIGEIDAAFPAAGTDIDTQQTGVRRLFPDGGRQFVKSFYERTAFTPANHTVLIRRQLAEENPWLAEALFEAFERSKQEAYRQNRETRSMFREGDDLAWQNSVFSPDPFPFGLAANRAMLTMAARQSVMDGLTRAPANVTDLFWESVRGT